mmetsp:Transcript_12733/g.53542  ORF Transcript_12733/g.53542 Transcript_12733/m.53542 type:complete len:680 (+) Transcript_12733:784-2823(+)
MVAVYQRQDVQQLPLVLVDALDLHVEERALRRGDAAALLEQRRQARLVCLLGRPPLLAERLVVDVLAQPGEQVEVRGPHGGAQRLGDGVGERGVAECQPAALRDAVGLVLELVGPELVEVLEDGLLDELRVDRRHAVDGVAGHQRQRGHAHRLVALVLLDDAHAADAVPVVAEVRAHLLQEAPVDVVDDLHVARQQLLHELHRPLLERLGQHGVVGEGEDARGDRPRRGPAEALVVHEHAHELGHADGRVRVVELDGHLVGELVEVLVVLLVAADHVLDGGADEEVLLLEAQLLALVRPVVGVEHGGDGLGALLVEDGRHVVAGVERLQVEVLGGLGTPQAQVGRVLGAEAWDRVVVRHRLDLLGRHPAEALAAVVVVHLHVAVEAHGVAHAHALDLPGVPEGEPVVGALVLEAVGDELLEHAVLVADAVAPRGQVERRHRIEEARGQAAQAAVAQRGVVLLLDDGLQVVAELRERLLVLRLEAEVRDDVEQRAAHQELHRKVVHALRVRGVEVRLRVVPALHQAVAHAVRDRLVRLAVVELVPAAGHRVLHVVDDRLLQGQHVRLEVRVHQREEQLRAVLLLIVQACAVGHGAGGPHVAAARAVLLSRGHGGLGLREHRGEHRLHVRRRGGAEFFCRRRPGRRSCPRRSSPRCRPPRAARRARGLAWWRTPSAAGPGG